MVLERIDILDFKNIREASLEFSPRVNCLLGKNGMGKSNLLEAVHMLSLARGLSSMPESSLIRHGAEMFLLKGEFLTDAGGRDSVACGLVKGKPKSLKVNGKPYGRISEHVGRYPVVTVSPADSRLVSESGEERRRLMDIVISQANPAYLKQLIRYGRALDSRNRMLRAGLRDKLLYESVESGMAEAAAGVHEARKEWVGQMRPLVSRYYELISGGHDAVAISYRSSLNDSSLPELLESTRDKDHILGFTSRGVHRDDIEMQLDGYSLRRLGSQGQVKSFTLALRLAIFDYLSNARGATPLLLLDDIFDKLDSDRVARIMQIVSSGSGFGQIFITDTNRKHLDEILAGIAAPCSLLEVNEGCFMPLVQQSKP